MTSSPEAHRSDTPHPLKSWLRTDRATLLALLIVVACAILRTLVDTATPEEKHASDVTEQVLEAFRVSKTAYALAGRPDFTPHRIPPKRTASRIKIPALRYGDTAIAEWRRIATGPEGRAAEWRRLGLTLAMFGRPGSLQALRHIAEPQARAPRGSAPKRRGMLRRTASASVTLPPTQELALWQAVFGAQPLTAARAAQLRPILSRLDLGWYEEIAAAQLYAKAGLTAQANVEAAQAYASAKRLEDFNAWEAGTLLLGIMGAILFALYWIAGRVSRQFEGNAAYGAPPAAVEPFSFSYRARTVAFVVYLSVFLVIGLPLRLLTPHLENLPMQTILRLDSILQVALNIPVILIALYVLRRIAASESPAAGMPTWRQTLAALGLRSRRPASDAGTGLAAYLLIAPIFLVGTLLSNWFFDRLHVQTPINPVQLETMLAQDPINRVLLLIVTSLVAPVVEELMFRGVLYPALRHRYGVVAGAAFSGAIFSIIHPTIPSGFLPLWILGFTFALVYEKRGSLLPNIVMHSVHNGLILVNIFLLFGR